jgi:hypothetical protein
MPPLTPRAALTVNKTIQALLTHPTLVAAARSLGVDRTTLWRFMRRKEFLLRYEDVSYSLFYNATSQLQQAACNGVDTLSEIMTDLSTPIPSRIAAASSIIRLAFNAAAHQDEKVQIRFEEEGFRHAAERMEEREQLRPQASRPGPED